MIQRYPTFFIPQLSQSRTMLAILMCLAVSTAFAQDWKLRKKGECIEVYTRPSTKSDFRDFKAIMEVSYRFENVVYVIKNQHLYPNLTPDTEEFKRIKVVNDTTAINYMRTEAPWPVDDRDGYHQFSFSEPVNGVFKARSKAVPDYGQKVEDVVRLQISNALWEAKLLSSGNVKIEYTVETDPGGDLPAWLVNSAVTDIPYGTFVNLKSALKDLE